MGAIDGTQCGRDEPSQPKVANWKFIQVMK